MMGVSLSMLAFKIPCFDVLSVFQICHEHDSILDACYVLEKKQYCNAESIFSVFQGES